MHYIKIVILILISGILTAMHISKADIFLCLALAIAFCERDKHKSIIISSILGVISAALSGGYMLFYIVKYMLPTLFATYVFSNQTKFDIVWGTLICVVITFISEVCVYMYSGAVGMWSGIYHSIISSVLLYVVYYLVIFRLINPRKRSYKITVR